jgi:hypothetical protein
MYDHIRPEGGAVPINWLVTPGLAFSHPNEVLDHPELSPTEQRAILASWVSDARALEGAYWMRCLDNGSVVTWQRCFRRCASSTPKPPSGPTECE